MKKLLFIGFAFFTTVISTAQDVITLMSGDEIQAKVAKVGPSDVEYLRYDNLTGPMYVIARSEVLTITYENGTQDQFNDPGYYIPPPGVAKEPYANLYTLGKLDASKYYKGYSTAGTGTLLVGLVSPLVGLVPAIACASSRPKVKNLGYPDSELIKEPDYFNGYSEEAKRIKKQKVWTNLGIAFGVNLVAVLILSSGQQ